MTGVSAEAVVVRPAARLRGELPAARRQVDQPPGADARAAGRRREPDRGRRRRRRRPLDGRRSARRSARVVERTVDDATGNAVVPRGRRRASTASRSPAADLDCGNSGTSLRLFAGILAGLPFRSVLDGDASLRRRPVARIIEPLRSMGAALHARSNDSLPPLTVIGRTPLRAVDVSTPVPSAQVKSAILLAALRADGRTTVRESVATRDHTERMLRARGVAGRSVDGGRAGRRRRDQFEGGSTVQAVSERVPGDVSAAAFWLVAGAIHPDAELTLRGVGVNPTRRAVIDLLRRMGAAIEERRRRRPRTTRGSASRSPTCVVRSSDAPRGRPRPARRRRRDRRDPGPLPRRHAGRRHDDASAAPASCATRNPTGSPASSPACARSGARIEVDGDDLVDRRPDARSSARRPTASTTTGWR